MGRIGQASLEFLTTYGWMLLVAAAVAGAMMYMGVFSPEKTLPQQCDLTLSFSCERFTIIDNGTVRVESMNKLGEPVKVTSFTCVYPDASSYSEDFSGSAQWDPSKPFVLSCNPPSARGGMTAGDRAQVDVKLEYKKVSGGFTKIAEGKVSANVVQS